MTESEIESHIDKIKRLSGINLQYTKYGRSINNDENQVDWSHATLHVPPENGKLINSPYYFTGKRLIHFTSEKSFRAIVNSKSLRLSNLHKLNDPREFSFAGDLFHLDEREILQAKNNFFTISFCDPSILRAKEIAHEFNLWRRRSGCRDRVLFGN